MMWVCFLALSAIWVLEFLKGLYDGWVFICLKRRMGHLI